MKAIVTGGAGFIGSTLVETLLEQDNEVLVVDRDPSKKPKVADILEHPNCTAVWRDINDYTPEDNDYDIIYHMAAHADIAASIDKPWLDFQHNTQGTLSVLEWMRLLDIPVLVNASSSAVYGESMERWKEYMAKYPINHYGASKLAAEAHISGFCSVYGLRAYSYRFANVVGRRPTRGVIYDFYGKLQRNPDVLEILGDGEQEKSFFDVDDCVRALITISQRHNGLIHEPYNIGNGREITVKQLADIVCDELDLSPRYEFTGGRRGWTGDVPVVKLDISKAVRAGWMPVYSCEEAVRRTVRWLDEH